MPDSSTRSGFFQQMFRWHPSTLCVSHRFLAIAVRDA
jgi:hypothetical protein